MGWNFKSFKTLKDNTYIFYYVFDSALNHKHNKQKAYPYPPSLRWDFQRKWAVNSAASTLVNFYLFERSKISKICSKIELTKFSCYMICTLFRRINFTTRLKFSFTFESRLISFPSFEIDRVNMPEPIIRVRRLKLKINFHASATCLKDLPRGHL